jgi:hypothetical protein
MNRQDAKDAKRRKRRPRKKKARRERRKNEGRRSTFRFPLFIISFSSWRPWRLGGSLAWEQTLSSGGRAVTSPLLIGWKEYVAFPEWNIRRLRAKIDTGACSSALDVARYELIESGGVMLARIRLVLNRRRPERLRTLEAPVLRMTRVTCSNGVCEQRPVVLALIRLGPIEKRIRLTLTNRATLRHRLLLGREALNGSFIVDAARSYVLGR